jgi:hypothetical protein
MARKKPKPDPAPPVSTIAAAAEAVTLDPTPVERPADDVPPVPAADPSHAEAQSGDAPPVGPRPFVIQSDAVTGVALREDKRFRQAQLQFRDKPSDAVRMIVREAGFTWQPTDRVWVKPIDREAGWKTRVDAERLFKEVVEEIAHEQGQTHSR